MESAFIFAAVTAWLALFCWVPMLLLGAPIWSLWAGPFAALAAGFSASRLPSIGEDRPASQLMNFAGYLAIVGASVFYLFGPGWAGWQWFIPFLSLIPVWGLVGFGALMKFAVWAMGKGLNG